MKEDDAVPFTYEKSFGDGEQDRHVKAGTTIGGLGSTRNYEENVVFRANRGHGFAAEKANHLRDKTHGKNAKIVGGDNAKNGADRIVNGTQIQTKYCATGSKCVAEAFDKGRYRYMQADGTPMQLEVPSDKYNAAIQAMEQRIIRGEVPTVTDPANASKLVRKGHYTYKQACNIAKFGTVESITYDAVNGAVLAGTAMGLTVAISFATAIWRGDDYLDAVETACFDGLRAGGMAWLSSIAVAQVGRTGIENVLRSSSKWLTDQMSPKLTSFLANAFRSETTTISSAAATSHVTKLLRGTAVTAIATTVVLSIDDFRSLFAGEISGQQAFKNITKTGVGVSGGSAGAWAGAAVGTVLFPGAGTVAGGIIGGALGSYSASEGAQKLLDILLDDDAQIVGALLQEGFAEIASDYLLSEAEAKKVLADFKILDMNRLIRSIYASKDHRAVIKKIWTSFVEEQVSYRRRIALPSEEDFLVGAKNIIQCIEADDTAQVSNHPGRLDADVETAGIINDQDSTVNESVNGIEKAASVNGQSFSVLVPNTLREMLEAYAIILNDGCSVYCAEALLNGKGLEKAEKACQTYAARCPEAPIVVVDTTVFGSGNEGFFLTENFLFVKRPYYDPMHFELKKLTQIAVDFNGALIIDKKKIEFSIKGLNPELKIVARCIQRHLDRIRLTAMADMFSSVSVDSFRLAKWFNESMNKLGSIQLLASNGMLTGSENLLQMGMVIFSRRKCVYDLISLKSEIEQKAICLHDVARRANKALVSYGHEEMVFPDVLELVIDTDTSTSNENWVDKTLTVCTEMSAFCENMHRSFETLVDRISWAAHRATGPVLGLQ